MGFLNEEERANIMNGTLEKKFLNARRELEQDYTESFANDFFYTYCDLPLSMILRHSRDIFSETYFGYDFYRKILQGRIYDTRIYANEALKVQKYLDDARKMRLPSHQTEKYEKLLDFLTESTNAYANTTKVFILGGKCENGDEFIRMLTDELYSVENDQCGDDSLGQLNDMIDRLMESIYSVKSIYCRIPLAIMVTIHYPKYIPLLREEVRRIMRVTPSQTDVSDIKRFQYTIQEMLHDVPILDALQQLAYRELLEDLLKYTKNEFSAENICSDLAKCGLEAVNRRLASVGGDANTCIGEIDQFMESVEENSDLTILRYDNLKRKLSLYEAQMDLISDYDELKTTTEKLLYENTEDMICELESQIAFYEWESDGRPNDVIRQHIMTSKEREAEERKKEKSKPSLLKSLQDKNQEADDAAERESELCEEIKKDIKTLGTLPSTDESYLDNEVVMNKLKGLRNRIKEYQKEISEEKSYSGRAKALCDDLCEQLEAIDPKYESVESDSERMMLLYLEDSSDDEDTSSEPESSTGEKKKIFGKKDKPKKPDHDLATKIQNKALDHAAKDEEKVAKRDEKKQKIKNAADAVSQKPKRIGDDITDFVQNFDKWDDNRRKKFLLKPGFRHKIFKKLRKAVTLGIVGKMKLSLIPVLALLNHCSKLKDQRIRNELTLELENEIKICEEKIQDANAEGTDEGRKRKYELMRIKDKLEAEKTRVRINSKYV